MDLDDRELVRRCLEGDQDACRELVDSHARMVGTVIWRAVGRHELVEDLAQETFMRVFRGLAYFDARSKLSTWIYTIAHRVAAAVHREQTAARDWQPWLQALERGALAGLGVYATAVVWQVAAPVVLMNVTVAGWVAATLSLVWGAYVSRSLFSRI